MVKKDNDMNQQKYLQKSMLSDMQADELRLSELRGSIDNLRNNNSALQRDIKNLQDLISEQRVTLLSLCWFRTVIICTYDVSIDNFLLKRMYDDDDDGNDDPLFPAVLPSHLSPFFLRLEIATTWLR